MFTHGFETMPLNAALTLTLAWLAYFAVHSALASLTVKAWVARHWPGAMPAYRLAFNALAVLLLLPLAWLAHDNGPLVWHWQGVWAWVSRALTVLATVGLIWSLRCYDGLEFAGLRQWWERHRWWEHHRWRENHASVYEQERFQLSILHRFVRHPWYFLGLLLVWTQDMTAGYLLSALLVSAYLVVGVWLEERKLLIYYGDVYVEYRRRVPGLLPLPWRWLDADSAQRLLAQANEPSVRQPATHVGNGRGD